ncbi:pseudouridine synthase family protein [Striga hermonthica]|uniref:Pseudouridine synthase family protein n=1 Tax=Striga hermonthica TaxID=68872 RepID=A0A9N7MH49_STRHE|nr:pseudouridine synthase family protein [Striga hermonthica]
MTAIVAATTTFSALHLSRTSAVLPRLHLRRAITSTLSSTTKFNITFAPPKPQPQLQKTPGPHPEPSSDKPAALKPGNQQYTPCLVKDESANPTSPPDGFLKAMAFQSTQRKKTKKKDDEGSGRKAKAAPTAEPKYSKAARRFYNERFREAPQRLAKVLAAAGVASRRSCEELIFQGKVTVNGSVCNTPQTKVDPGKDIIYVNGSRLPKKLPAKVYLALNKPKGYICSAGEKETKSVMSLFDDFMKSWSKKNPGVPKLRLFTIGRLDVHEGRNHEVRELVKNAGLQIHALKRVRIGGFRLPTDLALGKHIELTPTHLRVLGLKS